MCTRAKWRWYLSAAIATAEIHEAHTHTNTYTWCSSSTEKKMCAIVNVSYFFGVLRSLQYSDCKFINYKWCSTFVVYLTAKERECGKKSHNLCVDVYRHTHSHKFFVDRMFRCVCMWHHQIYHHCPSIQTANIVSILMTTIAQQY